MFYYGYITEPRKDQNNFYINSSLLCNKLKWQVTIGSSIYNLVYKLLLIERLIVVLWNVVNRRTERGL